MAETLPTDIVKILEFLALMARGYDNRLKWNEEAKLKADLMNSREYWLGIPVPEIKAKCAELGMRREDADLVADLVTRAQHGRRLVAQRSYRDHRFKHERPEQTERPQGHGSQDW
jgi:hypothetical protein